MIRKHMTQCLIEDWGLIEYNQAAQRQRQHVDQVINGGADRLIFCEHPPVITLGRMTKAGSLLVTPEAVEANGVAVCSIDRGGDATLHAPGQMVVYPVFNLNNRGKDLKVYMETLEQVAVDLLTDFGILAMCIPGRRGVFAGPEKIISIGVGVRKWVTYHGLAINVNTDLSLFHFIKPCGLDVRMTSMAQLKGKPVAMAEVKANVIKQFRKHFL